MRAQGVALGGVERAFQQGAKDGGLHLLPVGFGRAQQAVDLRLVERQHITVGGGAFEEFAVEAQHVLGNGGVEAAFVHRLPKHLEHLHQGGGLFAVGVQQVDEAALAVAPGGCVGLGQQAHVFGKHAEQTAGQKGAHGGGRVAGGFQAFGQVGQLGGDLAGDARADARGVEAERVGPQRVQSRADGGVGQLLQADAVAARVGKGGVGGAAAAEFGVELDDVAHVHHHHKGRAAFGRGQGAGVVFGLLAGFEQGFVKGLRHGFADFELFAFPDKVAAFVAVHPSGAGAAVAVRKGDGALEHVVLLGRGVRAGHAEQVAQVADEALCGGEFRRCHTPPFGDEGVCRCVGGGWVPLGAWCCHAPDDRS